jgi:MerR family transcriptional regulator, light-induced transcriptional regulator
MDDKSPPSRCQDTFPGFAPSVRADPDDVPGESVRQRDRLEFLLRSEILPRLADLHPSWPAQAGMGVSAPDERDIETFAELVISPDEQGASSFLRRMVARGYDFETLVERLAAPTARRLGELWEQDLCDFLDVTFGIGRLQEILVMMRGAPAVSLRERPKRALLVALPGDKHWFGLEIVSSLLSAAGWNVTLQHGLRDIDNEATVASDWFHVIGVTMGDPDMLDDVARTVHAVRRASRNPEVSIMVGGAAFNREPDLVARVGADGTAPDGPTAVVLAKRLLLRQQLDAPWSPG